MATTRSMLIPAAMISRASIVAIGSGVYAPGGGWRRNAAARADAGGLVSAT